MKLIFSLFLGLVLIVCGCASKNENQMLLLPYSAFGPPTMSGKLLGVEWFQWLPHGDSRPRKYDVKVIVYRDVSLLDVKNNYPVSSNLNIDYRYIHYSDAVIYFNDNITEVLKMEREGFPMGTLEFELSTAKAQIIDELGY